MNDNKRTTRDKLRPYLHLAALLACQGITNAGRWLKDTGGDVEHIGRVLFAAVDRRIER